MELRMPFLDSFFSALSGSRFFLYLSLARAWDWLSTF